MSNTSRDLGHSYWEKCNHCHDASHCNSNVQLCFENHSVPESSFVASSFALFKTSRPFDAVTFILCHSSNRPVVQLGSTLIFSGAGGLQQTSYVNSFWVLSFLIAEVILVNLVRSLQGLKGTSSFSMIKLTIELNYLLIESKS